MQHIFNFIHKELSGQQTQVVIVPSTSEITHTHPLPQPPMPQSIVDQSDLLQRSDSVFLTSNPCVFRLNDISVGVLSTDVIRDIVTNTIKKDAQEPLGGGAK
mmetsp:Transcript_8238/g.13799  ORF Transcript_8238/g.13799 Transcript_8238/m.13799 type:complete len:102 (+) Transcript_8238:1314-1619(+)